MNQDKSVKLKTWELATMQLEKLRLNDETLVATGNGMHLILPVELEEILQPLVGIEIRILHTDIPAKEYIIRVMSEKPDEQESATELSKAVVAEITTRALREATLITIAIPSLYYGRSETNSPQQSINLHRRRSDW